MISRPQTLKVNLGAQLDLARTAGHTVANAAEQGAGDVGGGRAEHHRVGQVGGVGADLQLEPFVDGDSLQQAGVEFEIVRRVKGVPPRVAELAGPRRGELGALLLVKNQIRPVPESRKGVPSPRLQPVQLAVE